MDRIRSATDLTLLNYSGTWLNEAWLNEAGTFTPVVSRYTQEELKSGLPFHADPEPVRFARNRAAITRLKGRAEVYALNWLARYNRMLKKGKQ